MDLPRPRTANPITHHQGTARANTPRGAGYHRRGRAFAEPIGSNSRTQEFTGIRLVKWMIANNQKEEARKLLTKIKTGQVSA